MLIFFDAANEIIKIYFSWDPGWDWGGARGDRETAEGGRLRQREGLGLGESHDFYTKINFCFNLIASADVITAIALHLVVKKHVHRYYETLIQNKIEKKYFVS